jgi:hypothetical protein
VGLQKIIFSSIFFELIGLAFLWNSSVSLSLFFFCSIHIYFIYLILGSWWFPVSATLFFASWLRSIVCRLRTGYIGSYQFSPIPHLSASGLLFPLLTLTPRFFLSFADLIPDAYLTLLTSISFHVLFLPVISYPGTFRHFSTSVHYPTFLINRRCCIPRLSIQLFNSYMGI